MRNVLIIIMLLLNLGTLSAAQQLYCIDNSKDLTIVSEIKGYHLIELFMMSDRGSVVIDNSYVLNPSESTDMYQSSRFRPADISYPVYHLGQKGGCMYLMALPGGDMREDDFVGLIHRKGKQCETTIEIEINCRVIVEGMSY